MGLCQAWSAPQFLRYVSTQCLSVSRFLSRHSSPSPLPLGSWALSLSLPTPRYFRLVPLSSLPSSKTPGRALSLHPAQSSPLFLTVSCVILGRCLTALFVGFHILAFFALRRIVVLRESTRYAQARSLRALVPACMSVPAATRAAGFCASSSSSSSSSSLASLSSLLGACRRLLQRHRPSMRSAATYSSRMLDGRTTLSASANAPAGRNMHNATIGVRMVPAFFRCLPVPWTCVKSSRYALYNVDSSRGCSQSRPGHRLLLTDTCAFRQHPTPNGSSGGHPLAQMPEQTAGSHY